MKTALSAALLLLIPVASTAQDSPSPREVTAHAVKAAAAYATAVSCQSGEIGPADVVALSPYTSYEDRDGAEYVVIWHGDIGCLGGHTVTTNLTSVRVGAGDSYVVDLSRSSPAIQLGVGMQASLVGSKEGTLIFETREHADGDANCCPSIVKRIILSADQQGNWKTIEG